MKLNEKTGLYENYQLWHVPFWQTQKFQWAVTLCVSLIIICIATLLIKKYINYRKKRKLPIWDQVLLDLNQLKQDHKVYASQAKEFYVTVSVLLKQYLHDRFGYDVIGKTDDELVDYLHHYCSDTHILDEIRLLLQGSTTIKFANVQAAQGQVEQDYLRAIAIITRTIPEKK